METAITALVWVLIIAIGLGVVGMVFVFVSFFRTKKKAEAYFGKKGEKIVEDLEAAARKKLDEIGKK